MNQEGAVLIQLIYSLQLPEFRMIIPEKLVSSKAMFLGVLTNICKVEGHEMPYASLYALFLITLLPK
jgi:hypothetical protein